jgi:hypothetical protein
MKQSNLGAFDTYRWCRGAKIASKGELRTAAGIAQL